MKKASTPVPPEIKSQVDALNASSWDTVQGNPRGALQAALKAARLSRRHGYDGGLGPGLLNAGWALIYTAEYEQAIGSLHEALDLFSRSNDTVGRLKVLNALGVISHRVGDTEKALERYTETLEIARRIDNDERLLAALNNLGELSASLGQFDEARQYYREADTVASRLNDPMVLAVVKVNLGSVLGSVGETQKAINLVEDGIALARATNDGITESEGLTVLGKLLQETGRVEEAEAHHTDGLNRAESIGHPRGIVTALGNLGSLYMQLNRPAEARRVLERASALSEEMGTPLDSLPAYEELATICEEAGDLAGALDIRRKIEHLQRAVFDQRALKRVATMRAEHELERTQSEAEIFRLRNVELREKTEELEAANARMQLISGIAREISAALDLDQLTDLLYRRINSLMEAAVFGIALYDETEQKLDYALIIEEGQHVTPFARIIDDEDSFGAWAVRNRKEIVIKNAAKEYKQYVKQRTPLTGKYAKSIVYLPLIIEDQIIGVLTVQSYKRHGYTEDQVDLLRTLGAYIAIALDNSRKHWEIQRLNREVMSEKAELEHAYDRIAHMANHDTLTELPNRRLLCELLKNHIPLARRQRNVFGLFYLDLDDFKPVNDTFGHAAGDAVLIRVAERLKATVRSSDTVARIGGDEFVLVVLDVDGRTALEAIGKKILESISIPIPVGEQVCTLGASMGVSVFPRDGESVDELIASADRAMYAVKQQGKLGLLFADRSYREGRGITRDSSISSSAKTN